METSSITKPTFEEAYDEINAIVQKRRSSWTYLSLMEWSDVSQTLLSHLWSKYYQFDPAKGSLEHWTNRIITYQMLNLKRNLRGRWERPCIGGGKSNGRSCAFNLGGDSCSFTKSGRQCAECPLYREWQQTREHQFNIKSSVPLENHIQEVSNIQEDFHDYDGIKTAIDTHMKEELTPWEYKVYNLLYIRYLSPTAASTELQTLIQSWKRAPREDERADYQTILQWQRRFREMMMEILRRQGHIES